MPPPHSTTGGVGSPSSPTTNGGEEGQKEEVAAQEVESRLINQTSRQENKKVGREKDDDQAQGGLPKAIVNLTIIGIWERKKMFVWWFGVSSYRQIIKKGFRIVVAQKLF